MRTWLWTKSPQLVLYKILELSPKNLPKMGNFHKEKESGVGATSPNFLGRANFWSSLLVAVLVPCKLFSKLTQMSSYQLQFQMWFVFIAFFGEVDQEKIRMRSVTNFWWNFCWPNTCVLSLGAVHILCQPILGIFICFGPIYIRYNKIYLHVVQDG